LKRFAFVSAAAEREYKDLPENVQDEFGKDLRRIQFDQEPRLAIKQLVDSVGAGVIELIINGSRRTAAFISPNMPTWSSSCTRS